MNGKPNKILLVETPAVVLEIGGELLGEVTLHHAKYTQLLLAANLSPGGAFEVDLSTEFVDLKAQRPQQMRLSRTIDYCGREVHVWRVGTPFEVLDHQLAETRIVGVSANYTFERPSVCETIDFVKRRSAALVVVGGHDATVAPQYYLDRGADICVLGEGESAIAEITRAVSSADIAKIPGIAYLDRGELKKKGKRKRHNLDAISYPTESLLRSHKFDECPDGPVPPGVGSSIAVIETSRGCDEKCSFCDSSYVVGAYRTAGLRVLRDHLLAVKSSGIRTILFADDNLLYRTLPSYDGPRGRQDLITLFSLLREMGFAWTFYNGVQFGLFERRGKIDTELISALFASGYAGSDFIGCFRAYIPLEKFTQPEMTLLPKLKPLEVEAEVLHEISRCRVPELNLGFIIGTPRDDPASIAYTFRKAEEFGAIVVRGSSGRSVPRFFPWCSIPLPGTPDHRYFGSEMLFDEAAFPELFSNYTSVLRCKGLSPLDITIERQRLSEALNKGRLQLHSTPLHGGTPALTTKSAEAS